MPGLHDQVSRIQCQCRAGFRGGGSGGSNPPFGNLATTIHYDTVCSFVVKKAHPQKFIALRIDTLVITCTSVKIKMWIMALKRNN